MLAFLPSFFSKKEEEKIRQTIQKLQEKYQAKVQTLNCLSAFLSSEEEEKKTCNFITEASFLPSGIRNIILGAGPVTAHEVNEYNRRKLRKSSETIQRNHRKRMSIKEK